MMHIPLWFRRVLYLVAMIIAIVAVERGWTTDAGAAQILAGLAAVLVPGLALANLADKPGRHRAN